MAVAPHPLRIFLCHSSGDKQAVRDLYQQLRTDGFDPWLDEENLLPGQDWQRKIPEAVSTADVVLVCLSRSSISKKGYVQKEIMYALDVADEQPEDTIYLIPLKLEECGIPERLRRWHAVSLYEANGHERLMSALRHRTESLSANLGLPPLSESETTHEAIKRRTLPEREGGQQEAKAARERSEEIQRESVRWGRIKQLGWVGIIAVAVLGAIIGLNAVRPLNSILPSALSNTNSPTVLPNIDLLNAETYFKRGYECSKKEDYDCAVENYTKVIELNPHDALAYNNRGLAYTNKGSYDLAIIDYNKAIELNPQSADSYVTRGLIYNTKGNRDKAIEDFTKAIELNPQSALAYEGRGVAHAVKKNYDQAVMDITKAIELNPEYAYTYDIRASIYEQLGQRAKAKADRHRYKELLAEKH